MCKALFYRITCEIFCDSICKVDTPDSLYLMFEFDVITFLDFRTLSLSKSLKMNVFYKLAEALSFAKSNDSLAIFSKQVGLKGEHIFIVGSKEDFWELYEHLSVKKHYEVIRKEDLCKLYFDLEFDIRRNGEKDGEQMTRQFVYYIIDVVQEKYQLSINQQDIIELDSSSNFKFSRHLVFR